MHSKIEVEFQGQIETVLKQSLADLDIKVKKIFQYAYCLSSEEVTV